jgi:Holliday junction resolvase-like predicted endonuclease
MIKRKFSKQLYDMFDQAAKDKLVAYLKSKGHTILNEEENYNVDVISQKNGYTYFNEAEVKTAWKEDWPTHWEEIRIPERKKRLIEMYEGENGVLNFYVFRKDLSKAWRIKDTLMSLDSLKEASGRYIRKGERFFHIPYKSAEMVEMT